MKSPTLPLRIALPLICAMLMAGSVFTLSLFLRDHTQHFLHAEARRDASSLAMIFMHVLEAFRGDLHSPENIKKLQRIVENTGTVPGVDSVIVVDREMSILASTHLAISGRTMSPTILTKVEGAFASKSTLSTVETLAKDNLLLVIQPVSGGIYDPESRNQVMALAVVVLDLGKYDMHAREQTRKTWFALGICCLVCLTLMYLIIVQRVIRPLNSIMETVRALGRSELEAQARVYKHDELGQIAVALNVTTTRLREVTVSKLELERVNNELISTQLKMVQSSKMASLGEMAGGVAHEINNPLSIILARSGQLREAAESGEVNREVALKLATKIEQTAARIAKIVRSLRWFARDGEADPFITCSVSTIVFETIELCQERFRNHHITLTVAPIDEDCLIGCRPVEISQVLLNLLNNAHDAVEHLSEKWVRIEVGSEADSLSILVTDSGQGVPNEYANRIMDPFFTTKEVGKGTGLGLSLSQGIIHSHKGSLTLDTRYRNTRFIVTLPKVRAAAAAFAEAA